MKKNKRNRNKSKPNKELKDIPVTTPAKEEPQQPESEGNNNNTPPPQKPSVREYIWNLIRKLKPEWAAVCVTFLLLIATGYNTYLTRQALHTSQRAFVYMQGIKVNAPPHKPGECLTGPLYLTITWGNSGETAARKAVFYVKGCIRKGWPSEDFSFPYGERNRPQALVPPKGTIQTVLNMADNSLADVELTKQNMTIYGKVVYLDIFDDVHTTEFCKQWNGYTTNDTTGIIEDNHWDTCQKYNCHDNDCPQQWGKQGVDCCSPEKCS